MNGALNAQELWKKAVQLLKENNIENAEFDANELFFHFCNVNRRLYPNAKIESDIANEFLKAVNRRAKNEPLQYILGEWNFYGFTLKVGKGVLIPRQDTETVCEIAINLANKSLKNAQTNYKIADLCAGSGAIAITLANKIKNSEVLAVEKYDEAFKYLLHNIKTHAPNIKAIKDDVQKHHDKLAQNSLDMIISNPPYIAQSEMQSAQAELFFEPKTALIAEDNGLFFYKFICKNYKEKLKKGGVIIFEIGHKQAGPLYEILTENKYKNINIEKDANGHDRCVWAIAK